MLKPMLEMLPIAIWMKVTPDLWSPAKMTTSATRKFLVDIYSYFWPESWNENGLDFISENNKGEVTYERGCIKRPVDFQEDEPCNEEVDVNGRKVKKCFCTDSKCNSVAQIAPMLASIAFGLAFLKIVFWKLIQIWNT